MRKKRKWLEEMIRNNDLILSATDRKVAPKDTDNLLGNPADETKIDGKATNALDNVPLEEPVSITPIGNIPLVRYSRYATEFEEFESLGKGGFGSVWRVRNRFDGRHYAVKKVHIIGTADDPLFQQRLERTLREVKILAALDHPNIVRYYNAWLEVEKEHQQTDEAPTKDSTFDENSVGMSRYSSSMLTDSVSQWPSTQFNQQPRRRPLRGAYEQEVSEEPSLFGGGAWRPLVENGSDYLIFEVRCNGRY
jgi:serine/threonine protein kinase